jgi:hypothetical protein
MSNHDAMATMNMSSDAYFRLWGLAVHDMLGDVGLVQTADTGQIDWATATRPATNTDAGYSIWRFDDALQATTPIFLKFMFGTGDAGGRPRMRVEVAAATNGSGTLSGLGSGTILATFLSITATDAVEYRWQGAGDGSGFWAAFGGVNQPTQNLRTFFVVDRFRDDDGEPNGDGFVVLYRNGANSASYTEIHDRAGSVRSTFSYGPCLIPMPLPTYGTTLTVDGELVTYPFWVATPAPRNIKMLRGYNAYDMPTFQKFTTHQLGADRTFTALGSWQGYWDNLVRAQASIAAWWAD